MRNCYIRTGGIYTMQAPFACPPFNEWRDTMGSEDGRPFSHLLQNARTVRPIHGHDAKIGELFDGMTIVDNLSNNIDGARQ